MLVGIQNGAATVKNSLAVPQKLNIGLPAIPLLGIYPKELKSRTLCMSYFSNQKKNNIIIKISSFQIRNDSVDGLKLALWETAFPSQRPECVLLFTDQAQDHPQAQAQDLTPMVSTGIWTGGSGWKM